MNLYNHFCTKMHIMQTFIDFYMHDRAEFRGFEVDFALREADFGRIRLKKWFKMANSALKRLYCAYDFDLFKFLYAFSREDGDLKEFARVICLWPLQGDGNLQEGWSGLWGDVGELVGYVLPPSAGLTREVVRLRHPRGDVDIADGIVGVPGFACSRPTRRGGIFGELWEYRNLQISRPHGDLEYSRNSGIRAILRVAGPHSKLGRCGVIQRGIWGCRGTL